MADHPLKTLETLDPKLFKLLQETRELALGEGVLPLKFKLLIILALDAAHGVPKGVQTLAQSALEAGATQQEIVEVVRIGHYVGGAGSTYTASVGLKDIF